eukprot:197841-Amphidinium_carterae.1
MSPLPMTLPCTAQCDSWKEHSHASCVDHVLSKPLIPSPARTGLSQLVPVDLRAVQHVAVLTSFAWLLPAA